MKRTPHPNDILIGEAMRNARKASKVSQAEMARRLGYNKSSVARWETGESAVTATDMIRYLQILDIDVQAFLEALRLV